jgi:hypothetical protein
MADAGEGDGDRMLYARCLDCPAGDPAPDCEACQGAGFMPTGLSMEMFEGMLGRIGELKDLAASILEMISRAKRRDPNNGA